MAVRKHVILRADEARRLLLAVFPALNAKPSDDIGETDLIRDVSASATLKSAVERADLSPILDARLDMRVIIARRILSFAESAIKKPSRIIARLPPGADERAKLFAAMNQLRHSDPFDFQARLRREQQKR